ncbi:MAG: hypothetical protein ACK5Q5_21390, partial [Planctomycetaceae bacterium]
VLPGLILPIVARTDLLLSKLIWVSRGSTKSRRDVKELARLLTVDEDRTVRKMVQELGHSTLLDELLAEPNEFYD